MCIYRATLVIKAALFISFIFILSIPVFSQNTEADSLALLKKSQSFLETNINFNWEGGNLKGAFDQLSSEHNLKFAYSDSKIQNVFIGKKTFSQANVVDVLGMLLMDSGFNYMIVGKSIIIIKDKSSKEITKQSEQVQAPEEKINSHVYPISSLSHKLTPYEKKILMSIYRKELNHQARQRKIEKSFIKDSLDNSKPPVIRSQHSKDAQRYYLKASLGWENYFLKYKISAL